MHSSARVVESTRWCNSLWSMLVAKMHKHTRAINGARVYIYPVSHGIAKAGCLFTIASANMVEQ